MSDYHNAIIRYKAAMNQAKIMLSKGIINAEEYAIIETKMCEYYCINLGSLYREIDLINSGKGGNMSSEEVM